MTNRARSQTRDRHAARAAMHGRRRRLARLLTVVILGMALIGVSAQASSSGFSRLTAKPKAFTKLGSRAEVSTKLGSRAEVSTKLGSGAAFSTRRSASNPSRANAAKLRLLVSKLRSCNRWFLGHHSHWWAPLVWRMCVGRALSTRPSDPSPPGDTTPPDTSIDAAPPASTESRSATFTFSSSEAGSSFECKLDSGSWVACDSPQFYSGLSVADHTLLVRATDAAGNVDPNPAVRNWTVEATPPPPPPPPPADTTPPQTSIGSGPAGDTTQRVVSFAFSSSEAGSSFQCKLDSGSWADCDSPQSYSGLAVADHSFSVKATDAAGNVDASPATRSWTVEATPPASAASRRRHASADLDRLGSLRRYHRDRPPASPSRQARRARPSSASWTRAPGRPVARRSPTRDSRSPITASRCGRPTRPGTSTGARRRAAGRSRRLHRRLPHRRLRRAPAPPARPTPPPPLR